MRASRAAVFAGVALGLGVTAHLSGGGRLPGLTGLTFLAIPVLWSAFLLARAQRRWPVVVAALLAVESGLHAGLSLLSGPSVSMGQVAGPAPMGMSTHSAAMSHTVVTPMADGMAAMPLVPGFAMIAAHLVATALTGLGLAYGEHLLWCLRSWLHHAVTVSVALIQLPNPFARLPNWPLTVSLVPVLVDSGVRRRGPPRSAAVLPACA
jgi:hypothetical protein